MNHASASLEVAQNRIRDEECAAVVNSIAAHHEGRLELRRSTKYDNAWAVFWRGRRLAKPGVYRTRPDEWLWNYQEAERILLNLIRISVSWRGCHYPPFGVGDVRRAG